MALVLIFDHEDLNINNNNVSLDRIAMFYNEI